MLTTDTSTGTSNGEAATITLTRDELGVFLRLLGVKALNGQPPANGAALSAEEEVIRRNSGEQTLQERGLLTFEAERHVTLDDTLVAIAGTAALPLASYMLQRVAPDGSRAAHYFSRGPDLLVEHTSPKPGIFVFRRIADAAALQQRVGALAAELAECAGSVPAAAEQVQPKSVADFLSQASAGHWAAAEAALVGGGGSGRLAGDLVRALKAYPHWLAVAGRADVEKQRVVSSTAMMVRGASCCWMFESDSNADGRVAVHALDGAACRDRLVALAQVLQDK